MRYTKLLQILHTLLMAGLAIYEQAVNGFAHALVYYALAAAVALIYSQIWTNEQLKKRINQLDGYLSSQLKEKNK